MTDGSAPVMMLTNGVVMSAWQDPEIFIDGAVAWSGDRILEAGPAALLKTRYPAAMPVDARGGMIVPGLINVHHHFYSALARGLVPESPPRDFGQILDRVWWRLDRALTPETVRLSALLGAADSIRWGCTTVFDHHASPSCLRGSLGVIARTLVEAGLSAVLCYEISDRNGHDEAVAGLVENLRFMERQHGHPRIRGTIGLHASFTITDETLDEVAERRPAGSGCHIHLAEDGIDYQVSKMAFGAAPIERLERRGLLDDRAILVHGVHLTSEGRAVVARNKATLVHCPESNANNAVGRLDVERAAAEGCTIALGTDGMSSAMLRSLRFAFLAQRAGRDDPTVGFAAHPAMLSNNVEVARRYFDEPLLGEIVAGAPADLCVIDCPPPTPLTADNSFGHVIYGMSEAPVRHTIARGEFLLEDYRHTTVDPVAVAEIARIEAPGLWERFHANDASPVDWLPV